MTARLSTTWKLRCWPPISAPPPPAECWRHLREKVDRKQIGDVEELKRILKEELRGILTAAEKPVNSVDGEPEVILVVGVNGTGKTTTIGKLAHNLRAQGKSVLLCAADTFRAAAIEQLEIWGERTGHGGHQDQAGRRSLGGVV